MATPKITIYSTRTCPFCRMEKNFLQEKKTSYNEIFVDEDDAAREAMMAHTHQRGVPVTLLEYDDGDKRAFIGFQQDLLEKVLQGDKVGDPWGQN